MATFLDLFWEYFSGKTLPTPTLIGLTLVIAISVVLTLIVIVFVMSSYGNGAFIFKLVGMTINPAGDDRLELELVSGEDLTDLVLLEMYINDIQAEPVSLPTTYNPGTIIFYKIPPSIGPEGYTISVIGTFNDGIVAELYTTSPYRNNLPEKI